MIWLTKKLERIEAGKFRYYIVTFDIVGDAARRIGSVPGGKIMRRRSRTTLSFAAALICMGLVCLNSCSSDGVGGQGPVQPPRTSAPLTGPEEVDSLSWTAEVPEESTRSALQEDARLISERLGGTAEFVGASADSDSNSVRIFWYGSVTGSLTAARESSASLTEVVSTAYPPGSLQEVAKLLFTEGFGYDVRSYEIKLDGSGILISVAPHREGLDPSVVGEDLSAAVDVPVEVTFDFPVVAN